MADATAVAGSLGSLTTEQALFRRTLHAQIRPAIMWGLAFAVVVVSSSAGYSSAYPDALSRAALQAGLGSNPGIAALFGHPDTLASIAGFTAWRSHGLLLIVGAVWALLLGCRLLRGEEDAGRWELVLAGRTTAQRATAATLAAGTAAVGIVALISWAAAELGGRMAGSPFSLSASLFLALDLVGPAMLFLAVGALTAQLFATRRQAAAAAAAVFGVLYLVRMVAGAYDNSVVLLVTPLGWYDRATPLTGSRWIFLTCGYLLALTTIAAAITLAGHRDLGAGTLSRGPTGRAGARLRGGATGLAVRLTRSVAAGWVLTAAVVGAMVGLLAEPVGKAAIESPAMREVLERATGSAQRIGATAFLGLTMLTITTMLALCAAAAAGSLRTEEVSGRLELLLSGPVSRPRWLLGRTAVATGTLAAGGLVVGLATWATATFGNAGISLGTMLSAGTNLIPVCVLVLASGVLAFGVAPRWTQTVPYALVVWSFLLQLVGSLVNAPRWVLDLSLLHHLALAPATAPRWQTNAVLLAVAVAAVGIGTAALRVRDLGR